MAFPLRVVGIGALAVVGFATSGCGTSGACPAVGGNGGNAAADAAPGSAGTGGNAGTGGWPVIVRLVNAGATGVSLPENLAVSCMFAISVAPAAGGDARLLSATSPDSWCDCARCGAAGRRVCDTTDPICDGPSTKLAPGDHLDIAWDGRIAITASPPPPGSTCPSSCDHWETVTPGDYAFTIETPSGSFTTPAAVPGSTGVISLAINI